MPKPVEELKDDIDCVIKKVDDLQMTINDLRMDFKDMLNKIDRHFKECEKIDRELQDKLLVNGKKNNGYLWGYY